MENIDDAMKRAIQIITEQSEEIADLRYAIAWSIVYKNNLALIRLLKDNKELEKIVNFLTVERNENEDYYKTKERLE